MSYRDSISGIGFIVSKKERLPYGDKDRGRFVPAEKGRSNIFVPSFGVLEKEEIDYIVEATQEKEDNRPKRKSATKDNLEKLVNLAENTPKGKRKKVLEEALKSEGRWI